MKMFLRKRKVLQMKKVIGNWMPLNLVADYFFAFFGTRVWDIPVYFIFFTRGKNVK